jgi:hypothetical protein
MPNVTNSARRPIFCPKTPMIWGVFFAQLLTSRAPFGLGGPVRRSATFLGTVWTNSLPLRQKRPTPTTTRVLERAKFGLGGLM